MFSRIVSKYEQAIVVAGCSLVSFATMGWMIKDIQQREKRQLINDYEKRVRTLTEENKGLKDLIQVRGIQF